MLVSDTDVSLDLFEVPELEFMIKPLVYQILISYFKNRPLLNLQYKKHEEHQNIDCLRVV